MKNNTLAQTSWKAMEYWRGSFYATEGLDETTDSLQWETIRDKSIKYFVGEANEYIKRKGYEKVIPNETVQIKTPSDANNNPFMEENNLARKYVRFPLFLMKFGVFTCKVGIRVNFCALPNLSKIFIYFICVNSNSEWDNNDLNNFKQKTRAIGEEVTKEIYQLYKDALSKNIKCGVKQSYFLELYNLGTTEKNVIEFAETEKVSVMKRLLTNSDVKKAYYTMVSLAGECFSVTKNMDDLKNELMNLPKQALVPSNFQCGHQDVRSIYAQQENIDFISETHPFLMAGITALDLKVIESVDWDKVSKQKPAESPFCRVFQDLNSIEAWHHSTSYNIILPYTAI